MRGKKADITLEKLIEIIIVLVVLAVVVIFLLLKYAPGVNDYVQTHIVKSLSFGR